MSKFVRTSGAFGVLALIGVLMPLASWAYKIECRGNWAVYVCKDGTEVKCFGATSQTDCEDDPVIGAIACSRNGGFSRIEPNTAVVFEYKGGLALHEMACTDCNPKEPVATHYAGWLGMCKDKAVFTCSDTDQQCFDQQEKLDKLCASHGGAIASFWHIDVQPQLACFEPQQESSSSR